jgi:Flp pilus assembly protein TadG
MPRKRPLLRKLLSPFIGRSSLLRNEKGAVAIEFGVLALPFFTVIYAIIETSIVFLAGQMLDSAVQDASRKLRTGQAQIAGWNAAAFRSAICGGLYGLFICENLKVKVSVVSSFSSATVSNPIDADCSPSAPENECGWTAEFASPPYDPGSGSSIVLVQAFYKWPTLINLPGFNLETQAGGTRLLSAVRVFRNEPF